MLNVLLSISKRLGRENFWLLGSNQKYCLFCKFEANEIVTHEELDTCSARSSLNLPNLAKAISGRIFGVGKSGKTPAELTKTSQSNETLPTKTQWLIRISCPTEVSGTNSICLNENRDLPLKQAPNAVNVMASTNEICYASYNVDPI